MSSELLPRPSVAFIPSEPYARAAAWLARAGHARDAMLRDTGIEVAQLEHPDGLLTLDQVEAFVRNAAEAITNPSGALEFGSELILPSHGILGYAGLTAPDMAAALKVTEDYLELVTPLFLVEREHTERGAILRLLPRYRMAPIVQQVHLRVFASSLSVAAQHTAGVVPPGLIVEVPADQEQMMHWLRELGLTVRRGEDLVVLYVPHDVLRIRFLLADARAHAGALERCREALAARRPQEQTIRDVRRVLRDAGPPFPDLQTTSKRVGVSTRTLRRRLAAEGSSFSELLGEARLSLAARLLSRTDRDITAIAYDLGYSHPANFTRAFGRALGVSPSVYRREQAAGRFPSVPPPAGD